LAAEELDTNLASRCRSGSEIARRLGLTAQATFSKAKWTLRNWPFWLGGGRLDK